MKIDCAKAISGWHHGRCARPITEGFVVCEEFKDTLVEAWNTDIKQKQEEEENKRFQKYAKKWITLTNKLLIRNRVNRLYNMAKSINSIQPNPSTKSTTTATTLNHVHNYVEKQDLETGICTKICECGLKVTFEKL